MALVLNNFIGFETGGLEEAQSFQGSPVAVLGPVRTGNFSMHLPAGTVPSYRVAAFEGGSGDQGNDYIVGFAFQTSDSTPAANVHILYAGQTAPDASLRLRLDTDGSLKLIDAGNSVVDSAAAAFTADIWHYIEIWWENADSGDAKVFIDDSEVMSVTAQDFLDAGAFTLYRFGGTATGGPEFYYDDIYCMSGATGTGDFLGSRTEVLGPFQNTIEDATDQGATLDQGTWEKCSDTPGVDDGTPAGYTTGSAQTGFTICDEGGTGGDRQGPAELITGVSKGAKYIYRLNRGSGSGTVHRKRWGKNTSVQDSASDIGLGTGLGNYFQLETNTTYMPNVNTDNFATGFLKEAGGREIYCAEMWSMLLHVAPDPSTLDLSDMEFPDQNYHLGPFGV